MMRIECPALLYDSKGGKIGLVGLGITDVDLQSAAHLIVPLVKGRLEKNLAQKDAGEVSFLESRFKLVGINKGCSTELERAGWFPFLRKGWFLPA